MVSDFEPRVRLIDVLVTEKPEDNDLTITVVFALKNSNTPLTVSTLLSRVR